MRWLDPDLNVWASEFEYKVYRGLKASGSNIRKSDSGDTLAYQDPVRDARCSECGGEDIIKSRSYTPDLVGGPAGQDLSAGDGQGHYFIEAKGYLRGPQRRLLRAFRQSYPRLDWRFIIQRDYPVGKGSLGSWITKYLKCPWALWRANGELAWQNLE